MKIAQAASQEVGCCKISFLWILVFIGLLTRYTDSHGQKRVAGRSGLKSTELYTPEFGRALAMWWSSHGSAMATYGTAVLECQGRSKGHNN